MMKQTIKIDVVSDVVCPWCYIGKRRLENALDQLRDEFDVELEYHPFELNPGMPAAGVNSKQYLTEKFGGEERYEQLTAQVSQVAQQEGLTFDYGKQITSPNTRKAHSLIKLAKLYDLQVPLVEAFFKAYFTDGIDLTQDANLIAVAEKTGLKKEPVEKTLADENVRMQIALEEKELGKLGITGVPFYIINNRYGISGAQPAETFVRALREAGSEKVMEGESCDVDKKNC